MSSLLKSLLFHFIMGGTRSFYGGRIIYKRKKRVYSNSSNAKVLHLTNFPKFEKFCENIFLI